MLNHYCKHSWNISKWLSIIKFFTKHNVISALTKAMGLVFLKILYETIVNKNEGATNNIVKALNVDGDVLNNEKD